jgi:Ankyrin repeats (3 copies)
MLTPAPSTTFVTVLLMSAFEDALHQCSTEHFQAGAALSLSATAEQEKVKETMKTLLWQLLTNVLTRNDCANSLNQFSWSLDGYSMVARIAKSILSSWCIDTSWISTVDDNGDTLFLKAAEYGHTSVVELLLADPRADKASINHVSTIGWTALICAASYGHTSIVELLLADARVDQASFNHTNASGCTALWRAARPPHYPIVKLLISDSRTGWDSIVELTHDRHIMQHDEIPPLLNAELTRRQMRAIYPSANRLTWPVPVQSNAESGDAESSGPAADDDGREESDGIAESEPVRECALTSSFFRSDLFDVNVLRIIREYAAYTCSNMETYSDSGSGSDSDSYY